MTPASRGAIPATIENGRELLRSPFIYHGTVLSKRGREGKLPQSRYLVTLNFPTRVNARIQARDCMPLERSGKR